jgi:predicted PurR-regulated permease PerM
MNHRERHKFDLSYTSIIRVILVLALLLVVYLIRDIIALVFVSVVFAAAINPWVQWFHKKWHLPKVLGVVIIYLMAFAIISMAIGLIVPALIQQIQQIVASFPELFQRLVNSFAEIQSPTFGATSDFEASLGTIQQALGEATQGVFSALSSAFGGVIFLLAVLVLTLYLIIEEDALMLIVKQITPPKYHNYLADAAQRVQNKMGQWLRGQLFLMLFVGVLTYIGLLILGMPFALVLALLAGIFELIPYAGPLLGGIPAVIVALNISPLMVVLVIVLYFLVQQIENHLLVPKVMEKAVGLNPVIIIVAVLIGAKIGGILGAILAVPVATVLATILGDIYHRRYKSAAVQ